MGVWRDLDTGITVEQQILKMESTIKWIYVCMQHTYIYAYIGMHVEFISATTVQAQLTLVMHMLRCRV